VAVDQAYPVRFSVDYPDRSLDRGSTFFRIFYAIPILILLATITGGAGETAGHSVRYASAGGGGLLFFGPLLMILFRQKYPRWWFDWNVAVLGFSNRVYAYLALMNDQYPSTDEEQSVHVSVDYPDVPRDLNRWLPLVKWLLAIPHYIVLFFLTIAAVVAVIVAWFAILFTGTYPRGLFTFVEGTMRWGLRVVGYAFLMVTDKYPPFSLEA
jgi:hypothetical protein